MKEICFEMSLFFQITFNKMVMLFVARPSRPMSPVPLYGPEIKPVKENDNVNEKFIIGETCGSNPAEPRGEHDIVSNVNIGLTGARFVNGIDEFEEVRCDTVTISDCDKAQSDIVANGDKTPSDKKELPRDASMDTIGEMTISSNLATIALMDAEDCGCPLQVFVDVSIKTTLVKR